MKGWTPIAIAFLIGVLAGAQTPLAPPASPDQVLELLQALPAPPDLKESLAGELTAAMNEQRLTPGVALAFLGEVAELSQAYREDALGILNHALAGGYILDPLLNEALKGLRLGRPWPEVAGVLKLRIRLLDATQQVLQWQGVVLRPLGEAQPLPQRAPQPGPPPEAALVLEIAWAIGDFLVAGGSPADAVSVVEKVEERLLRLRGLLPVELVDHLLAELSPALVRQIVGLALSPERR